MQRIKEGMEGERGVTILLSHNLILCVYLE